MRAVWSWLAQPRFRASFRTHDGMVIYGRFWRIAVLWISEIATEHDGFRIEVIIGSR